MVCSDADWHVWGPRVPCEALGEGACVRRGGNLKKTSERRKVLTATTTRASINSTTVQQLCGSGTQQECSQGEG
jgi:hypothetical protein